MSLNQSTDFASYTQAQHFLTLLERAIDRKIEEQAEFVQWWKGMVSVRYSLNRHSVDNADPRSLSKADAEQS